MRLGLWLAFFTALSGAANAESVVLKNKDNSLSLSIYNQNLALVKDIRPASLTSGANEVVFDGVAEQIQAETAIIYGENIEVSEQNYSYNLMNYDNFLTHSIGKKVKTVRTNPTTGENIYEEATLIGEAGGRPILQFAYGIDSNFPGRVVFDNVPAGMSNHPTLTAKLNAKQGGSKNLYLAYLTGGLSWKTDYVANVRTPDKLDLTGWVTINNESGVDYEKAKIQLIAGDVNIVRPMMQRSNRAYGMMKAMALNDAVAEESMIQSIEPESINSYELYTLPNMTTIKNRQTKQVALIEKLGVTYEKEFNLTLPIYFDDGVSEFEKRHPSTTYVMKNEPDSNLGISLPAGTMRFYQNDKSGNMQFIGSGNINNTAKEDKIRLTLGDAFNISVSGKVKKIGQKERARKLISNRTDSRCFDVQTVKTYDVEITVNNAEDNDNTVILSQNFPREYEITKESIKSEIKNASQRQWKVKVSKNSKEKLTYKVDLIVHYSDCN